MSKLYVIPGHGHGDPGAVGGGQNEADSVRNLARRVKELAADPSDVELHDFSRNAYAQGDLNTLSVPKGTMVLELHRDSANGSARGAHVIIKAGFEADAFDKALAKNLSAIFPGRSSIIVGRSDLANANRAARRGINYRLAEVGFIDNITDRTIFNSRLDEIATAILKAFGIPVKGGVSSPTPAPAPSKPTTQAPAPSKPSTSSKNFGGTYRVNCDVLNVRSGPGTGYAVKAIYKRGQTVVLDNWYKSADGYIWGRYTGASSGQLRYVAVGKATGKPEPNDYLVKV